MWTEGQLAEIRAHVDRGLSRGAIAQIYGTTRNAIVGLCHRNGITGPNNQIVGSMVANERRRRANTLERRDPTEKTRERWIKKSRAAEYSLPVFPVCPDEPEPLRISLLDLEDSRCHWVCEGTDDHCLPTYCGHPSVDGRWCAHHRRRVYS